ncbi:peptidoglycan DD-metalloendopeptidase family protein [Neisseria iguanae]|uniref:Peptidoglycan-binding protein LysM n=1 Tax=Neisseria iguanae TaxID=90242 RepID=A0A2P7TZ05_9NEIS|nr:peptidoglycan DD-metalloendopeptidase family protein [Neisseria iguanae]PSJ79921.1 peptidoglycan-binding protein LysM [Neisseria iguanae]
MLKKTALYAGSAALALFLSACASQQPAPVVAGTSSTGPTSTATNPYGATPYDPNAASPAAADAPYVPPAMPTVSAPAHTGPTGGTYVPSYAPVDVNAATHTVVRGDTVYNISKRYGIDQNDLRSWNNLADNTIGVGQVLRVKPAGYVAPATAAITTAAVPAPTPATTATVSTGSTRTVSGITWQRPTVGKVVTDFGGNNKGVDISGNAGQPVVAAADGKVVYAGSGLRGYGNLVIVQHNSTFLTAYGHNQSLMVNEGQTVKRGQIIAKMGSTDAPRNQLHFEVRQNGKPVNPTAYVPF